MKKPFISIGIIKLLSVHELYLTAYEQNWIERQEYQAVSALFEEEAKNLSTVTTELPSQSWIPGLMTGHAGLAYQLMRKESPSLLPSFLLLG